MGGLVEAVSELLHSGGVELTSLGLALARVTPVVALVPAFGLKVLPAPIRGAMALLLAIVIAPGIAHVPAAVVPWPILLFSEAMMGLALAVATAVPLWAITMTGGLFDQLRGSNDAFDSPLVQGRTSTFGVLLAMMGAAVFLRLGGASHVAERLLSPVLLSPLAVAQIIASGIELAVLLAAPMIVAAFSLEVGSALMVRSASPAQVSATLAPIKAFGLLAIFAVIFRRMVEELVRHLH